MGWPKRAALFYSYPLPLPHRIEIGQGGIGIWQTARNEIQCSSARACGPW